LNETDFWWFIIDTDTEEQNSERSENWPGPVTEKGDGSVKTWLVTLHTIYYNTYFNFIQL
jgi:hypothetical protein